MRVKKASAAAATSLVLAATLAACGGGGSGVKLTKSSTSIVLSNGESISVRCPNGTLTGTLEASPFIGLCTAKGTPPTTVPTTTPTTKPTTSTTRPTTTPSTAPSTVPTTTPSTVPVAGCTNPAFVTATPTGYTWPDNLITYNSQWNDPGAPASGPGSQIMSACSAQNWSVVADMPPTGQPTTDVKTYPNAQENFAAVPISQFTGLTSTFAETDPHVGDYEDAYDIWINGEATSGSNELMIWNENNGQTPAGSVGGSYVSNGVSYTVYHTSNNSYIAFVANTNYTAGNVNILGIIDWLMASNWISKTSVLNQIDYGVEICSTGGAPATFGFTNFSLSVSPSSAIRAPKKVIQPTHAGIDRLRFGLTK